MTDTLEHLPLANNPAREAAASARGYWAQIWRSVHAWTDLEGSEQLYLEGAEDFDRISGHIAEAVQVKDSARNITLRSGDVIKAIDNAWELQQRNKHHSVKFRFLTRACIGIEQGSPFGTGVAGLRFWQESHSSNAAEEQARSAKIIGEFLIKENSVSNSVLNFLRSASGEQIWKGVISLIEWDTEANEVKEIIQEVKDRLVVLGERFSVTPDKASDVAEHLYAIAFERATRHKNRHLTRAEMLRVFSQNTHVSVPAAVANAYLARSTEHLTVSSENFVLDPILDTLPPGLRPAGTISHRESAIETLRGLFTDWHANGCLVALSGPPLSGKTSVFQQFAAGLCCSRDPPIAILHVDISASLRPLRSLYVALRGAAGLRLAIISSIDTAGEDDDLDSSLSDEAEFVRSYIPNRLAGRKLIAFFENYPEISGNPNHVGELQEILRAPSFRRAFNLLETHGDSIATQMLNTAISLDPFSASQSKEFLASRGLPGECANDAIDILEGDHSLFYPGILLQGVFRYDPRLVAISGEKPTAEGLALTILEHAYTIADIMVRKLCALGDRDHRGAMVSLMSMAVFQKTPITPDLLSTSELAQIPKEQLQQVGWLERPHGTRLIGFGYHAIRAAAVFSLSGQGEIAYTEELRAGIQRLSAVLFKDHGSHALSGLDETVAWLKRYAPQETKLIDHLLAILHQESMLDPVSPTTNDEAAAAATLFLRNGQKYFDLDSAIAALTLYARLPFVVESQGGHREDADFLESLRGVAALMQSGCDVNSRQLFALDAAIYIGMQRFHLLDDALIARKAVYAVLIHQQESKIAERDSPWLSAWLSFLMNIADLNIGLGEAGDGAAMANCAEKIIQVTNCLRDDSWKQWLLARLAMLRGRLATDASERKASLIEAVRHSAQCFAFAFTDPRCVRFYLRTLRRLIDVENDDSLRRQHVNAAREYLETFLGPCDEWGASVRAPFASVMRREARRAWNVEYQRARVREALSLLWGTRPDSRQEINDDPRASLVEARLQAFLGEKQEALLSCNRSLSLAPTSDAWSLKLRLLDSSGGQNDWSQGEDLSRLNFAPLGSSLKEAISDFRTWTKVRGLRNASYGAVVLWIVQREWQAQGSLERHVTKELLQNQIDYKGVKKDEKLRYLSTAFERRKQQLTDISKRFGRSIPLIIANFRNTAQFVRSQSVVTHGPSDVNKALAVIDDGLDHFPRSNALLCCRAEYLRYIWDVPSAIEGFRKVRIVGTNGDIRRRASLHLVRCLLTLIVHDEDADEQMRSEWIREAESLLEELTGSIEDASEISILKDFVAFEATGKVDWPAVDDMYARIVGAIDGFPSALIASFDNIQRQSSCAPENIAHNLRDNFADPECLGSAGLLYLRRAEKEVGGQQQADFSTAVAFLRAQALIERSWSGQEYPVTSIRIGRAIMAASKSFRSLNPINGLDTEGRPNQLALAEAKFNSARERGVGAFREMAHLRQRQASLLCAQLKREAQS